jgi:hypothetical protein
MAGVRIQEISPEDSLESTWLPTYEKHVDALWWELIRLNSYLLALEKIADFPFQLFLSIPFERHFWTLVERSFFESCVLIIWRIGLDQDGDVLTLLRLKNWVMQHIKEDCRAQLRRLLRDSQYGSKLGALQQKITYIRHNYLAHFNREIAQQNGMRHEQTILLSELKGCRDSLNELFGLLCFGHDRHILPWGYTSGEAPDLEWLT